MVAFATLTVILELALVVISKEVVVVVATLVDVVGRTVVVVGAVVVVVEVAATTEVEGDVRDVFDATTWLRPDAVAWVEASTTYPVNASEPATTTPKSPRATPFMLSHSFAKRHEIFDGDVRQNSRSATDFEALT